MSELPAKRFEILRTMADATNAEWTRPVLYLLATPHFAYFSSIWIALPWLAVSLALEGAFLYAVRRSAKGDARWRSIVMTIAAMLPWPWVVYAIVLWAQNTMAAQAGALCAMFTSAMVGSLRPSADKRHLMATMAPPIFIVFAILATAYVQALPAVIIPIALCSALGITVVMLAAAEGSYVNQQRLRQMRAELKAERDALDRRVKERTAQLEEATARANAASLAKSQFIANMSHELRTPLNAIIGFSEIVMEDLQARRVDGSQEDLERIRNAGKHLLGMINDVLDLASADTDQISLKWEEVDIAAVLRETVDSARAAATARNNRIALVIGAGVAPMLSDTARVKQALQNLLSNACKFTADGLITVTADAGGDHLVVAVQDTGVGIPPAQIPHLFQAFAKGDGSTTRVVGGAGIGLIVTRNLARAMGGDVSVESKEGVGTIFTLRLPRRTAREIAAVA